MEDIYMDFLSKKSILALVEVLSKHKKLTMQEYIDDLKIEISKDGTFYKIHKMFLNAYKINQIIKNY
jgi:hypothetical protein